MKIENNRKAEQVMFKDLHLGDCFELGNNLYLKTDCTYDNVEGEVEYNSVFLADGDLACFDDTEWVKNVNAKIVIE
jgi:hypothetical protein